MLSTPVINYAKDKPACLVALPAAGTASHAIPESAGLPVELLEEFGQFVEIHTFGCRQRNVCQRGHKVSWVEFGECPVRSGLASPLVKTAPEACREVYGQEQVVWPNFAGSGLIYPFTKTTEAPVLGLGIG